MANGQTPTTVYDPCTRARENKFNKTIAAREYAWNFKIFPTFPSLWGRGIRFHTEQASASSTLYQITFYIPAPGVLSSLGVVKIPPVQWLRSKIAFTSERDAAGNHSNGAPLPEPPAPPVDE